MVSALRSLSSRHHPVARAAQPHRARMSARGAKAPYGASTTGQLNYTAHNTPKTSANTSHFSGCGYDGAQGEVLDQWYFRARYYDAELGRFVSRDPLTYVDGYSMYRGYFVPALLDPFGLNALNCPDTYSPCRKVGADPKPNGCGPEGWKNNLVPNRPLLIGAFGSACDIHDMCYVDCGKSQKECDDNFYADMTASCERKWGGDTGSFPPGQNQLNPQTHIRRAALLTCYAFAKVYVEAVRMGGEEHHRNGQLENCECCCNEKNPPEGKPPRVPFGPLPGPSGDPPSPPNPSPERDDGRTGYPMPPGMIPELPRRWPRFGPPVYELR